MPASATAKRTTSRSSAPRSALRPPRAKASSTTAPRAVRRKTAPPQPTRSKSVVARAAPHWTETIEPKTIAAARRVWGVPSIAPTMPKLGSDDRRDIRLELLEQPRRPQRAGDLPRPRRFRRLLRLHPHEHADHPQRKRLLVAREHRKRDRRPPAPPGLRDRDDDGRRDARLRHRRRQPVHRDLRPA